MTMKSTGITTKNFGAKLAGVIKTAKTMRSNLQNLLLFGMEHYAQSGDTVYLTKCMQSCVGVSALPTQKMKQFIQEHANVSWREIQGKNGKQFVFKKVGDAPTYKIPAINWWDISKAGDASPDMDTDAAIINLRTRMAKKLEAGTVKNKANAKRDIKALDELITKLKLA